MGAYKYLVFGIVGLALFLFYMSSISHTAQRQYDITRENNTYHRVTSCILSVPLTTRTDAYISKCYTDAEEVNNIKVDRFGNK